MRKKLFIILFIIMGLRYNFETFCTHEKLGESWHFDTAILRDHARTKQNLLDEGFQEIRFNNEDNRQLGALFLEREGAEATMIFTHGFCPGGKEVFAPFVEIAPKYCNLLFLDLYGYGDSGNQNIFSKLKNYGKDNYKDIKAAIDYLHAKESTRNLPIIAFGWCAGGFHSATALIDLKDEVEDLNIKGLIFDSGFGAIREISDVPMRHIKENYVPGLFAKYYGGDKKQANRSYVCKITRLFFVAFLKVVEFFIKPAIEKREPQTNLYDKIHNLKTPTLVIHNEDDEISRWENVQKLTNDIPKKDLWLIERGKGGHATNHLKVKGEYQERMRYWTDKVLHG